jgi:cyclic peptide transporter
MKGVQGMLYIKNKKVRNKIIIYIWMMMFIWMQSNNMHVFAQTQSETERLKEFIQNQLQEGDIPGMSVVVIKQGEVILEEGFGYSDTKEERAATKDTSYMLGSYSEVLTALGILQLNETGMINFEDSVDKYIPDINITYKGKKVNITIAQLLYNTTGISQQTVPDGIEPSNDSAVIDMINSIKLSASPGDRFNYSPVNTFILDIILKNILENKSEDYIRNNVLKPLYLEKAFQKRDEVEPEQIATTYKVGFGGARKYDDTFNKNDTLVANIEGMRDWLNVLLDSSVDENSIFNKIHAVNYEMRSNSDGLYYAGGWYMQPNNGLIYSNGNSPGSTVFVAMNPEEKNGVSILSNLNSEYVRSTGLGIIDIMEGTTQTFTSDYNMSVDRMAIAIIGAVSILALVTLFFAIVSIKQVIKKERNFKSGQLKHFGISLLVVFTILISLYNAPYVFLNGISWDYIRLWFPVSVMIAMYLIIAEIFLFYIYFLIIYFYPKNNDKPYFSIIIFSVVGGMGYAFVMLIVNTALSDDITSKVGLLCYFVMGLIFYIFGQRIVRSQLTVMTNGIIFDKRIELISMLLKTPFYKFEKVGGEKIYTTLNTDTEVISNSVRIIVLGITSSVTIICTFVYLGISSLYALIASIIFVLIGGGLLMLANKSAEKYWEESRDIQNTFFTFINDLLGGFKELYLHRVKRLEFKHDIVSSCAEYREGRTQAELVAAYVYFVGELLAFIVLGGLVFILPLIITDIPNTTLSDYVLLFLFLKGPIDCVMDMIPRITQMKVSWRRINKIRDELFTDDLQEEQDELALENGEKICIELDNVQYSYKNEEEDKFHVGPISCNFSSGEIVFITGGNGSGKSTLAKLITGLYPPDSGIMYVNGEKVETVRMGEYFSAVFTDYYLFSKIYGTDYNSVKEDIKKYLSILKIDSKIHVNNGVFSTLKLSTGQKKRLALLISYIDNRPVYIFDEWAADQDPEFRKIFYLTLLPELKAMGKCVIVVTHDDRYFNTADKIIKLDAGKIVE